jgi:hypothetical protein
MLRLAVVGGVLGMAMARLAVDQGPVASLCMDLRVDSFDEFLGKFRLGGDAEIVDDVVRLTADRQGQAGWMWSVEPTPLEMARQWTIEVDFRVYGNNGVMFGDGLALWLTREPLDGNTASPAKGQSLGPNFGMPRKFRGLGVFVDTFDNSPGHHSRRFPFISAVFHPLDEDAPDVDYAHNSEQDSHKLDVAPGCSEPVRTAVSSLSRPRTATLRLQYDQRQDDDPKSGTLSASILISQEPRSSDNSPDSAWRECFSYQGLSLPPGLFLGISSATGDLTDTHDVDRLRVYAPTTTTEKLNNTVARPTPIPRAVATKNCPSGPFCGVESEDKLDELVQDSPTMRALKKRIGESSSQVNDLEQRLQRRIDDGRRKLEDTLADLERVEGELDAKLAAAEQRIAEMEALASAEVTRRGGWFETAVTLLLLAVVGLTSYSLVSTCASGPADEKSHAF